MLVLDWLCVECPDGTLPFRGVKALTSAELAALAGRITSHVDRHGPDCSEGERGFHG